MKRTKLCAEDVCGLAEICLCKCFFLWSDEMRILKNFGFVGLSVMVWLFYPKVKFIIQSAKQFQKLKHQQYVSTEGATIDALQRKMFLEIHRKTSVLESRF